MSKQQQQTTTGGVSTLGVVQIVFIILKLVGVISWSWWLVLAPTWICIVGAVVLSLIIIAINK